MRREDKGASRACVIAAGACEAEARAGAGAKANTATAKAVDLDGQRQERLRALPADVVAVFGYAYRAVYTVRLVTGVVVLHVFQKKIESGIGTPDPDMELIEDRLKKANALMKESQA